jgi:hypothetical protein
MPIPPKKVKAFLKNRKPAVDPKLKAKKPAVPPAADDDADTEESDPGTDMSKMHGDEKETTPDDEETTPPPPASKYSGSDVDPQHADSPIASEPGEEDATDDEEADPDAEDAPADGEVPVDENGEPQDDAVAQPSQTEEEVSAGSPAMKKLGAFAPFLSDATDILSKIIADSGDVPLVQDQLLSDDVKDRIKEEIESMPDPILNGFRKEVKGLTWDDAQKIAAELGVEDSVKFGAWLYFAGKLA